MTASVTIRPAQRELRLHPPQQPCHTPMVVARDRVAQLAPLTDRALASRASSDAPKFRAASPAAPIAESRLNSHDRSRIPRASRARV